jgi:hypothetical protein
VLERHVHVGQHALGAGDRLDEPVRHGRRIQVEQPDPVRALHPVEGREHVLEARAPAAVDERHQVLAPGGGILGDQVQLAHADAGELLHLGDEGGEGAALELPADARDGAEGADAVAALGDLHVGRVAGAGEHAR